MIPARQNELREKAKKALREEWVHTHIFDGEEIISMYEGDAAPGGHIDVGTIRSQLDAIHIEAFQPKTALELLDHVRNLESKLAGYAPLREFYGPAGLNVVSAFIQERDYAVKEMDIAAQDEHHWAYWRKRAAEMTDAWRESQEKLATERRVGFLGAVNLMFKPSKVEEVFGQIWPLYLKELDKEKQT